MQRRDFFRRLAQVALGSAAVAVGIKSESAQNDELFELFKKGPLRADTVDLAAHDYESLQHITWESWESIGTYVTNVGSVRRLELYTGSKHEVPDKDTLPKGVCVF